MGLSPLPHRTNSHDRVLKAKAVLERWENCTDTSAPGGDAAVAALFAAELRAALDL